MEAVETGKSNQQKEEGTSKGTKRPAEDEASREAHPVASLRLAPNSKRQKTDAEWGMVVRLRVFNAKLLMSCPRILQSQCSSSSTCFSTVMLCPNWTPDDMCSFHCCICHGSTCSFLMSILLQMQLKAKAQARQEELQQAANVDIPLMITVWCPQGLPAACCIAPLLAKHMLLPHLTMSQAQCNPAVWPCVSLQCTVEPNGCISAQQPVQANHLRGHQETHFCWLAASLTASVPATWLQMTWRRLPS